MKNQPDKQDKETGGRKRDPNGNNDVVYAPGASTLTETRDLTVLIWEADRVNRAGAAVMIAGRGHAVTTVKDLDEVREALAAKSFDLVLVDLDMFESDGLATVKGLKDTETAAGRNTSVAVMTSDLETYGRQTCMSAGLDGHLQKPFLAAALMDEFERMF